jgi:glycosyltransferase involved in cell wall biosynthesis
MIKFSVIITSYNRFEKLKRSISSALHQTYSNFEIIIVDDCSTDGSKEYLEKLDNPKISVFIFSKNKGQAKATNFAVEKAKGNWIAFLDADDYWSTEKLSIFINEIQKYGDEYKLFYSSRYIINSNGEVLRKNMAKEDGFIYNKVKLFNPIGCQSAAVVEKDAYITVGGLDEKLAATKDWDLWIRLSDKFKVKAIREPLTYYEENNESISSNLLKVINGREQFWNKHFPNGMNTFEKRVSYTLFGKFLLNRGHKTKARKYFLEAWKANIAHPLGLLYFIGSFLPLHLIRTLYKYSSN